jgi:predicted ester cyclase
VPAEFEALGLELLKVRQLNEHNGGDAANFLTPDMQWYGGTVGTVSGRANVAGLFAGVVAAFPDAHITIDDIFGQGDQVVVRMVVSGTQEGPILGIPASGRHVQWDGVDIYRLSDGKISNIWAGDDWTAILNDTGTYKAPWIPCPRSLRRAAAPVPLQNWVQALCAAIWRGGQVWAGSPRPARLSRSPHQAGLPTTVAWQAPPAQDGHQRGCATLRPS